MPAYVDPAIKTLTAAVKSITDNTGGTVGVTHAGITAGASYAQADMVAVKNAIASLTAITNALAALIASTVHSPIE